MSDDIDTVEMFPVGCEVVDLEGICEHTPKGCIGKVVAHDGIWLNIDIAGHIISCVPTKGRFRKLEDC